MCSCGRRVHAKIENVLSQLWQHNHLSQLHGSNAACVNQPLTFCKLLGRRKPIKIGKWLHHKNWVTNYYGFCSPNFYPWAIIRIREIYSLSIHYSNRVTPLSLTKSFTTNLSASFTDKNGKMVQWPIINNSHAYPFCKTMPGTQLFSIGHCTIFCQ